MDERITRRISRESGVADLVEILAERLTPTDLQSLLLEVYGRRAARLRPNDVLRQYERNRFVQPSRLDPASVLELDQLAFSLLPSEFEGIELSPVAPLGTSAALGGVSQDWAVSTARNIEVVSDSTNVLALESARRRGELRRRDPDSREKVKLAASHRLLRGQALGRHDLRAHFRLFGLCTAGRGEASHGFELESLVEHLDFYLRLLGSAFNGDARARGVRVSVTCLAEGPSASTVRKAVFDLLSRRFPEAEFQFDPDRRDGYYVGMCFHIHAAGGASEAVQLVDGGFTGWSAALLSDRKERLLISGIGTERLYGRGQQD